jgi:hypothetical protein
MRQLAITRIDQKHRSAAVGIVLLVLATGCLPLRERIQSDAPSEDNCIKITLQTPSNETTWELRKDGPCTGTIATGILSPPPSPNYDLPPEIYEECRRLLESTRFMEMSTPLNYSAEPTVCISARFQGRFTSVYLTTQTEAPRGFPELKKFLESLPARGQKRPSTDGILTNGPTP